ncbi:hypothetical protein BJV82DRAFT_629253 [Fennellomyces sp. T-0311]|nr:hypothetical protein BJV82DRAFT_629253 [Fennellomyces sp. T-0311]
MYKLHIEPYADSMLTWSTDQAKMLQTAALDRATAALDRAKSIHALALDQAKTFQTYVHHQLNSLQPTASDQDAFDEYYSATMTPYETQLPHKEIQAILSAAKHARSQLDDQLRTVQRHLPSRLNVAEMKRVRVVGDAIKSDMEMLRRNAENHVVQRAKEARQSVDDENELMAIRQAERQALLEVRKSDILMDEIRLEIDHNVEATAKRWRAAR